MINPEWDTTKTILVWRFEHAPKELQKLSTHGGDEDWIAFVPNTIIDDPRFPLPSWLESQSFSCVEMDSIDIDEGTIYIGAHS